MPMPLKTVLLFLLTAAPVFGQASLRYYVRDDMKAPDLVYTVDRDCIVYDWGGPKEPPCLQYFVRIDVEGCARKSFTYEEQAYNKKCTREQMLALAAIMRQTNLTELSLVAGPSCEFGWLVFDDKQHDFTAPLGTSVRDRLQNSILSYLDKVIPRSKRDVTTHTIEGDFEPPLESTVHQLLASPAKYDGKRVRLTCYYHEEFEDSSLTEHQGDNTQNSIWLSGQSTFAKESDLHWTEDGHVAVEGTFASGPGGHWGAFPGEIQRVTKFISLDPPPPPAPPKPFTAQGTKH
jgi:hypothetical protein